MINDKEEIFVLKSRQIGFSTLVALYIVYNIIFQSNKTIAVVSSSIIISTEILKRVYEIYDSLPVFIKNTISFENKNRCLCLTNKNIKVIATSSNSTELKDTNINELILDEIAFINSSTVEEFIKTYFPIVLSETNKKLIIGSSLNPDNEFFMTLLNSYKNSNDFKTGYIDINVKNYKLHTPEKKNNIIEVY